jgi:hypothetical protein
MQSLVIIVAIQSILLNFCEMTVEVKAKSS